MTGIRKQGKLSAAYKRYGTVRPNGNSNRLPPKIIHRDKEPEIFTIL